MTNILNKPIAICLFPLLTDTTARGLPRSSRCSKSMGERRKPNIPSEAHSTAQGMGSVSRVALTSKGLSALSMSDSGTRLKSFYDLTNNIPVPIEPEVFVKTWIFTHGIATLVSTNTTKISQKEIQIIY